MDHPVTTDEHTSIETTTGETVLIETTTSETTTSEQPPAELTHKLKVTMTCSGCSGAVERALKKTEGVTNVDINLPEKEVIVTGTIAKEDLIKAIEKTGKKVIEDPLVQ